MTRPRVRRAPKAVMGMVWFGALLTFAGFVLFDPGHSVALATSVAGNVAVLGWATIRLWEWDILLTPFASVVLGPTVLLNYSWGNLGARLAGLDRYGGNGDSLSYYPLAALLSLAGLCLYCWALFSLFARQTRFGRIRYDELFWKPWQAPAAALLGIGVLGYLSLRHPFTGGYFRNLDHDIDRWIAASQYTVCNFGIVIGCSVVAKSRGKMSRTMGAAAVIASFIAIVGLRARTPMIAAAVLAAACWITLRPRQVRTTLLLASAACVLLFIFGTVVKRLNVMGSSTSILDNLAGVRSASGDQIVGSNRDALDLDVQYRTAGLELPAALLLCFDGGEPPMYGEGIVDGLVSGAPNFIRPAGAHGERASISRHYLNRGLDYDDSIGTPLASGIADWGVLGGPLIYAVMAGFYLVLWRVVQFSPKLFTAFLMSGYVVQDMFWEEAFLQIRIIGFAWILIGLFGFILAPRWRPRCA